MHCIPGLDPTDIVTVQSVNRKFLALGRDVGLWRVLCFERSYAKTKRRAYARLWGEVEGKGEMRQAEETQEGVEKGGGRVLGKGFDSRIRALVNWDPSYPDEKIDFYGEYIRRHADISTMWFKGARNAAGMGVLYDEESGVARKVLAPLEDGSMGMWECECPGPNDRSGLGFNYGIGDGARQGDMIAKSIPGLLLTPGNSNTPGGSEQQIRAAMTASTAAELVSIDNKRLRGYVAVQNVVNEIDLATMSLVSRNEYPFRVMALSEAKACLPITVGTSRTLHLLDTRYRNPGANSDNSTSLSLGRSNNITHKPAPIRATTRPLASMNSFIGYEESAGALPGPDPLSILHLPRSAGNFYDSDDIWVAGRFKSILKYDRRFFPRLSGSIYSGASVSSICALPYPLIPPDLNLIEYPHVPIGAIQAAKSTSGLTLIAAGEYKQKGSLELFGINSSTVTTAAARSSVRTSGKGSDGDRIGEGNRVVRNCVNASNSKLLSVAAHGASIAYSDGSGYIRWMERDAFTPVRKYEVDLAGLSSCYDDHHRRCHHSYPSYNHEQQYSHHLVRREEERERGSPPSRESQRDEAEGDIVKRLLPTLQLESSSMSSSSSSRSGSLWPNQNDLVIWTGEGHLGLVGFGKGRLRNDEDPLNNDDGFNCDDLDHRARSAEEQARFQNERMYGKAMRQALERQADEVSFMRGLGLGG